jgi:cytochrome b6-f complex iron-sulfur subunit
MSATVEPGAERCESPCPQPCASESLPPGIDRRTFLAAAAALALAACAAGDSGGTGPSTIGTTIDVTTYSALSADGGVALISLQGTPLAIVRTNATTYLALSRVCPHQGSTVNKVSTGFLCPRHGAAFDTTGKWVGGERTSSLRSYPTTYDPATHKLTIG